MTDEYLNYVDELPWDNPPDEVVWMFVRYLGRYAEGLMAPNGPGLTPDDKSRVKRALKILSRKVNKFIKSFLDPNRLKDPSEAARGYEMLRDMFEAVFTIAAPMAIAEGIGDAIEKENARKTRAKLSEMGRKSGEKRRKTRPWVPHAEELAKQSRRQHPEYSQDDLASDVWSGWKLKIPEAPGPGTLKKHISAMIKAGTLPPRNKKRSGSRK